MSQQALVVTALLLQPLLASLELLAYLLTFQLLNPQQLFIPFVLPTQVLQVQLRLRLRLSVTLVTQVLWQQLLLLCLPD
jgi:hypothetical protein